LKKPPKDCLIKRPFKYVSAVETDIARTIREARKALEEAKPVEVKPTNVRALKKERQAA